MQSKTLITYRMYRFLKPSENKYEAVKIRLKLREFYKTKLQITRKIFLTNSNKSRII